MAQTIIGLDIGSWSIKAMVLQSSLRKQALVGFREHHLPVDAAGQPLPGELPAAIRATLANLDVDVLATAVPGVQVLTRELKLPFSDPKRISSTLGFQLESKLPRSIDTVVYDWHMLKKEPDGATLLCPAADKIWLEGFLKELKAAGTEPRYVTLGALAMGHLTPHVSVDAVERPWVFLDMGHRATQITLVRNGKVEAFRTLSRGGHHVTQAIARQLGVSYSDAEHAKHKQASVAGDATMSPISRAAGQALEPLFREIKLSMDAFAEREGGAVSEVVLTGGAARLPGIQPMLERLLNVPVGPTRFNGTLWDAVRKNAAVAESGLTAAALALEHTSESDHRVNFRRAGSGFGDLGALRDKAPWIAAFVVAALVIFFIGKQIRLSALEDQQAQLAAALDKYAGEVLVEPVPSNLDTAAKFKFVQGKVTMPPESEIEAVYPGMTAFRTFYEVTRAQDALNDKAQPEEPEPPEPGEEPEPIDPSTIVAPADRKQIELATFTADIKSATVGGIGYDIGTIEDLASRLRQNPCFKKVDLKETRKTTRHPERPSWLEFTLKLEVKCDVKTGPATASSASTPDKASTTTTRAAPSAATTTKKPSDSTTPAASPTPGEE